MPSYHEIDPKVPGIAPACIQHATDVEEMQKDQGKIARELAKLQTDVGDVPDPTAQGESRSGHGIKGALARIFAQLEELTEQVTALTKRPSNAPPTATATTWGKKVGWVLLILAIGAREARSAYTELMGGTVTRSTSTHVLP